MSASKSDLDLNIIEAVQKCPELYKTNATIAERQFIWQKLSESLNLGEQFVKSRWHLLRNRYQFQYIDNNTSSQNGIFKYGAQMEFLRPHLHTRAEETRLPANVIKPEFIITEKDLEDLDATEGEEHVFLEVEALEGSMEEDHEHSQEPQQQQIDEEEEVEIETQKMVQTENKDLMELLTAEEQSTPEEQKESRRKAEQHKCAKEPSQVEQKPEKTPNKNINPIQISAPRSLNSLQEAKAKNPVDQKVKKSTEASVEVVAEPATGKPSIVTENVAAIATVDLTATIEKPESAAIFKKEPNDRCEDDIFGELVTAMLKRMPAEKKRSIKKEIMNLLLT